MGGYTKAGKAVPKTARAQIPGVHAGAHAGVTIPTLPIGQHAPPGGVGAAGVVPEADGRGGGGGVRPNVTASQVVGGGAQRGRQGGRGRRVVAKAAAGSGVVQQQGSGDGNRAWSTPRDPAAPSLQAPLAGTGAGAGSAGAGPESTRRPSPRPANGANGVNGVNGVNGMGVTGGKAGSKKSSPRQQGQGQGQGQRGGSSSVMTDPYSRRPRPSSTMANRKDAPNTARAAMPSQHTRHAPPGGHGHGQPMMPLAPRPRTSSSTSARYRPRISHTATRRQPVRQGRQRTVRQGQGGVAGYGGTGGAGGAGSNTERSRSKTRQSGGNGGNGRGVAMSLSPRASPRAGGNADMELSVARGTFNVSATSTRDPKDLLDEVAAVLKANGVAYTPSETFGFRCHKVRTLRCQRDTLY